MKTAFFAFLVIAAMLTTGFAGLVNNNAGAEETYTTTYYVSYSTGNDNNTGLDSAHPWQTFTNLDSSRMTLAPGTAIYLKRGDTWPQSCLHVIGKGTAVSPILLSAYGEGPNPRITGRNLIDAVCIQWENPSYIRINSMDCRDAKVGLYLRFSGVNAYNNKDVQVTCCHFQNMNSDWTVDGKLVVKPPYELSWGSGIWLGGRIESDDNRILDGFLATHCGFKDVSTGVGTNFYWPQTSIRDKITNFRFEDSWSTGTNNGIFALFWTSGSATRVETYSGIDTYIASGASAGFLQSCKDFSVTDCEFAGNLRNDDPTMPDACGFDFEGNTTNCVFSNNVIHDNDGEGMLWCPSTGANRDFTISSNTFWNNCRNFGHPSDPVIPYELIAYAPQSGPPHSGTFVNNGVYLGSTTSTGTPQLCNNPSILGSFSGWETTRTGTPFSAVIGRPLSWTFDSSVDGWGGENHWSGKGVSQGSLVGTSTGDDPFIVGPLTWCNTREYRWVHVRMSQTAGSVAQIYFQLETDPTFTEPKVAMFPIIADGAMHDYIVAVGPAQNCHGVVTQWRLDPTNAAGSVMAIDRFEAMHEPYVASVSQVSSNILDVSFNQEMLPDGGVFDPNNYALGGAGQGTAGIHPSTVSMVATANGPVYRLNWHTGVMSGTDITLTVTNVQNSRGLTIWNSLSENHSPQTPAAPAGPSSGETGTPQTYSATTTDPDGGTLKYGWDWNGDSTVDEWSGLVASGTTDTRSHLWPSAGTYSVKVKAQDEHGVESGWSAATTVSITTSTSGPIAWWKLDDGSGSTTAADSSGNGNTGTLHGPTWVDPGKIGKALSFDGNDDYVSTATDPFVPVTDTFTMALWANPTATRVTTAEANSGVTGTSGQRFAIFPTFYDPTVGAGISVGTNGISVFEHTGYYLPSPLVYDATISGWTHIVVVYTNKQPKLYVNGNWVRDGLTSTKTVHPGGKLLGDSTTGYGCYQGQMDEVRIYDRALDVTQIAELYQLGGNTPPGTPTTPSGPASGTIATTYTYSTAATDPDGDQVKYGWDWDGNGVVDEWSSLVSSGTGDTRGHSWPSAGTYNVKVKAEDEHGAQSGWSSAKSVEISVPNSAPSTPSTPSGPSTGDTGTSYSYSTSTTDTNGDQLKYGWDWDGDGTVDEWSSLVSSGTGDTRGHSWPSAGTYNVKVKAEDEHGAQSGWSTAKSVDISVLNTAPTAAISADPISGIVPVEVNFSASGSTDTDGTIASYEWDFGDGSTSSGEQVQHTYTSAGSYLVTLTVTDDDGDTGTDDVTITISSPDNQPPMAVISADIISGDVPLTVNLSGAGSSDPDGSITSYEWDFGDGATGLTAQVQHTYTDPGMFTVYLKVTDDDGATGTDSLKIIVSEGAVVNTPPVVVITVTSASGFAPLTVELDGSGSYDPDGTVTFYSWDLGDGNISSDAVTSHIYRVPGNYTVKLTVTDDSGDVDTASTSVVCRARVEDEDNDGLPNNEDPDDDNDGVPDEDDMFPFDPGEDTDTDLDGTGDNVDADDDGDRVPDVDDDFPLDPDEWIDTDNDGTGDNTDTDDDGDGVLDVEDMFPLDPSEWIDTDLDGTGNNADTDDDGDDRTDVDDMFPLDPSEWLDTDGDGMGNAEDTDDDGDGVPDMEDEFPLDPDRSAVDYGGGEEGEGDTDDDDIPWDDYEDTDDGDEDEEGGSGDNGYGDDSEEGGNQTEDEEEGGSDPSSSKSKSDDGYLIWIVAAVVLCVVFLVTMFAWAHLSSRRRREHRMAELENDDGEGEEKTFMKDRSAPSSDKDPLIDDYSFR